MTEDDLLAETTDCATCYRICRTGDSSLSAGHRVSVVQTSVVGALLTALATIQALQFRVPLTIRLQAQVIAILAAIAFALPVALARWVGIVPRSVPY